MTGRSLRARLTLFHGAVIALAMVAFAVSALWVTGRVLLREETRALEETARRVGADIEEGLREGEDLPAAVRDAVAEQVSPGLGVEVRNGRGELLGSTPAAGTGPGAGKGEAEGGDRNHALYRSASGFTVDASVEAAGRRRNVDALLRALLLTGLPLLVLAVLMERFITTRALRPLEEVTGRAGSASVEAGVRSLGGPVGIDEVDRLTAAFNRLLAGLDDARIRERRFAADASHELRTPLTVLLGELELASASAPKGSAGAESVAAARGQARRMSQLVDALLLLRRLSEPGQGPEREFETVNLADVVRDVCREQIEVRPDRAGDLTLAAPDEVPVRGHPSLLASALANLVDNALKFTRPGQAVRVELTEDGNEVRVTVTDAGRGVPPGEADRLFDPFFRGAEARAETPGFGLGLPLLRRVARAHGGDVDHRPAPSGGACFVLRLPAWSSPPPPSRAR